MTRVFNGNRTFTALVLLCVMLSESLIRFMWLIIVDKVEFDMYGPQKGLNLSYFWMEVLTCL